MRLLSLRSLLWLCVASLLALPATAQVLKGSVPAPTGSTILVPEDSFPGGVLTGVVIGPDDKPVANAQVNMDGGVPITLSGEVIGDPPSTDQKPQTNRTPTHNLLSLQGPEGCADILQKAQALAPGGPPLAWYDPQGQDGEIGDITNPSGGTIKTDAHGRFALCVPPDAKKVDVSLGDGSVHTSVPASPQFPPDPCAQGGRFFQPAARVSVCQKLSDPVLTQGGQTWNLQRAVAISSGGDRVLTSLRTPRDLKPGPATLSFVNGDGKPVQFTGGVFKIINARLDREQLHSHQGADFEYTAQFGDGSVRPCVHVTVVGPIMLVQPPPEIIVVDANGVGRFKGKIRATQVAPGSTVPFDINPTITNCGINPGPIQTGEKNPGPIGTPGEVNPGPINTPGGDVSLNPQPLPPRTGTPGEKNPGPPSTPSDSEMKLSLTPGPVAVNPFVKQGSNGKAPAPQQVAMTSPTPGNLGPEHTMDETAMQKYEKAPKTMSPCNFQTTTPVITAVEGVTQPTVFTQQQGLNYFTVHGCNFGTTPGHVYLVLKLNNGYNVGFGNAVELHLVQGTNPWQPNSIAVQVDPSLGGYLDQTGVTLRVVTSKGQTAELHNQTFHAERVQFTMLWMPRSQVQFGSANPTLTPTFTTAPSQNSTIVPLNGGPSRLDPMTAAVDRTITNVGGPFSVQDDIWSFSQMQPGFQVSQAVPYYENWGGAGCSQTSGKWGTYWDSATQFRVHVQGCFHSGTGAFRSSNAHYGLLLSGLGPKGVMPWPDGMK